MGNLLRKLELDKPLTTVITAETSTVVEITSLRVEKFSSNVPQNTSAVKYLRNRNLCNTPLPPLLQYHIPVP